MKQYTIEIDVDTNDYDDVGEKLNPGERWDCRILNRMTFHEWHAVTDTKPWFIEGDLYNGTVFRTEAAYDDSFQLQHLLARVKHLCEGRLIGIRINDVPLQLDSEDELGFIELPKEITA